MSSEEDQPLADADGELATVMQENAQRAIALARKHYETDLDYSLSAVRDLENALERLQRSLNGWVYRLFLRRKRDRILANAAVLFGAYLGEVLIREYGGVWQRSPEGPSEGAAMVLLTGGIVLAPPERVYKRLTEGEAASLSHYVAAIPAMRGQAGIDEEDEEEA